MTRYSRSAIAGIWTYVVFSSVVVLIEWSFIPAEQKSVYFVGKFLVIYSALLALPDLRRDAFSWRGNAIVALSFGLYAPHGELYRPLYEYSLMPILVAYAFLLHPGRILFYTFTVLSCSLFSIVYYFRFAEIQKMYLTMVVWDAISCYWAFAIVSTIVYQFFTRERVWREQATLRFSLIGRHAATIIHDVKNMITAPQLQLHLIRERLENTGDSHGTEMVRDLETQIDRTQRLIFDLSQMAKFADVQKGAFALDALLQEVVELLRFKLTNVHLCVEGTLTVHGDRAYMYSILLNLFLNSLEAFKTTATKSPTIDIKMGGGVFVFSDNGAGFPSHVLSALSSGKISTTRVDGTGLGLFLVRDGAADFGSKVQFSNCPGARIEIRF